MPAPEGSGSNPSLFASVRSFWSVIVAILYTRLDLATAELEDEATRALRLLLTGIIAVLGFAFAFFFAMYFVIAMYWDTSYRLLTIGLVFGIYFVVGVVAAFIIRNMILTRPRFLSQTLAELKRDVESLKTAVNTHRDEPKP